MNQKLLLQNEYLVAENRILRSHLPKRLRLNNPQRSTLAEIGKRLGRKALSEIAIVAKPETILSWYRRLVAQKFDGSKQRKNIGRPPLAREVVDLVVRMAKENSGWGYDRIVGALSNLVQSEVKPKVPIVRLRDLRHCQTTEGYRCWDRPQSPFPQHRG